MTTAPQTPAAGTTGTPQYAVVVATRGRGPKIVHLMDSLLASEASNFELVVVDQSEDSTTREAVEPYLADCRIRYVHSSAPGTSRSRNLGVQLTTAPYIAITDDDCMVPPNWLSTLARPFEEHERVGVVFCSVRAVPVNEAGLTPQVVFPSNSVLKRPGEAWRRSGRGLSLGAGMAIRRTTFDDVGGFDELLGPGATFGAAEDNDLSWRALMRGWWTFENADVAVLHDGFRPMAEVRALMMRDFYGVGGTAAKFVRVRQWEVGWLLGGWLFRFGVVEPLRELLGGRRPRGFRRPYMLLRGLLDGLRTPLLRAGPVYGPNSSPGGTR